MSAPIRNPRKRPAPSARDQEIYLAYQVSGKTQAQLAEQYGLLQCRISQIVRRVADWRSKADPRAEGELTTNQRKRLDRWLEHERLGAIARQALQSFHHEQRTIKNTKSGDRDGKMYTEETTRELPASVQWLKTALRAIELLSKFEDKPYIPAEEPDERQRRAIMHAELRGLRGEAEQAGKVSPTEDPWGVLKRWLDALQGEPNDFKRSDPAMRELATNILPPSDREVEVGCVERSETHQRETCNVEPETCPHQPETCNEEPETASSPPINTTYASSCESPQPVVAPDFPAPEATRENSSTTTEHPAPCSPYSVPSTPPTASVSRTASRSSPPLSQSLSLSAPPDSFEARLHRRLAHERKLEQFREANRRGLPCMIEFDPADGPLPELSGHLDDYGYIPSPPTKDEDAQMVKDYLAKLRAERRANA